MLAMFSITIRHAYPWLVGPVADVGIYLMPPSGQHMRKGAAMYCFFTAGPAIASAVHFHVMNMRKMDAIEKLRTSHGWGEEALLTGWQQDGYEHSFGKMTGLLIGLLAGPEKWGGTPDEESDSDMTEDD